MTKWSFASSASRHRSAAAAVKRTVERAGPWFIIVYGLYLAFASGARQLGSAYPFDIIGPAHIPLVGLIFVAGGSWEVGRRLFVWFLPNGYTRPAGPMVIATLLNAALALGLAWCGFRVGANLNAADATRAPWDGRTLAIAAALYVAQGIGLPLYASWRWSGVVSQWSGVVPMKATLLATRVRTRFWLLLVAALVAGGLSVPPTPTNVPHRPFNARDPDTYTVQQWIRVSHSAGLSCLLRLPLDEACFARAHKVRGDAVARIRYLNDDPARYTPAWSPVHAVTYAVLLVAVPVLLLLGFIYTVVRVIRAAWTR